MPNVMPILTVGAEFLTGDDDRFAKGLHESCGMCMTSSRFGASSMRTANSSPPSRAAVVRLRRTRHQVRGDDASNSSGRVSRLSLIILKLSRSKNKTATYFSLRSERASAD